MGVLRGGATKDEACAAVLAARATEHDMPVLAGPAQDTARLPSRHRLEAVETSAAPLPLDSQVERHDPLVLA
jgi:hypothetical protein